MMAEDLKSVAHQVVEDVLNGVNPELNKVRGGGSEKSCQRSLLCVLFSPSMYRSLFHVLQTIILTYISSGASILQCDADRVKSTETALYKTSLSCNTLYLIRI